MVCLKAYTEYVRHQTGRDEVFIFETIVLNVLNFPIGIVVSYLLYLMGPNLQFIVPMEMSGYFSWFLFGLAGYIQWFVLVPKLYSRFRN